MFNPRVIPSLLLDKTGMVKTVKFKSPKYLGDPINIVRLFNEKEADELAILDISATLEGREPSFKLLEKIASEAFMPLSYGGGICKVDQVKTLISLGMEKIIVNCKAVEEPSLVSRVADRLGSQSVVVSIDVKKGFWGKYEVRTNGGRKSTGLDPAQFAVRMEKCGAGEIFLNSIDRDGTMEGYDLSLIKYVASAVTIPVIACGGAGSDRDLAAAMREGGASAVAAGSMFVYQGPHRAVLISYKNFESIRSGDAEHPANRR